MAFYEVSTPETEMHDVEILKNDLGIGITIAGYVCDQENLSGIFVKDISTGSAADLTGNIQVNDRIVKVNGKSLTTIDNRQAINLLRNTGPALILSLERYLQNPGYERLQQGNSMDLCFPETINHTTSPCPIYIAKPSFEERVNVLPKTVSGIQESTSPTPEEIISKNLLLDIVVREYELSDSEEIMYDEKKNGNSINTTQELESSDEFDANNCITLCNACNETGTNKDDSNKIPVHLTIKHDSSINSDSSCIYFSKASDDSEKDGYETCIDESLSEETCANHQVLQRPRSSSKDYVISGEATTNKYFHKIFVDSTLSAASSELCINSTNDVILPISDVIETSSDVHKNSKSCNNERDVLEPDKLFFDKSIDNITENNMRSTTSDRLCSYNIPNTKTYKCLLREYYNDYKDCLEEYILFKGSNLDISSDNHVDNKNCEQSQNDSDPNLFMSQILRFKSSSDPYILRSFYELECCRTFNDNRRFSCLTGCENKWKRDEVKMTVTSKQMSNFNLEKKDSTEKETQKHWGSTKHIEICRAPDETLGISIVCGKIDLQTLGNSLETTSGIFVKSIIPNSPAGNTGQFHTGDRILKVGGIDLTEADHEEAAAIIRSASNPITFLIQPLLPLKYMGEYSELESDALEEDTSPTEVVVNQETVCKENNLEPSSASSHKQLETNEHDEDLEDDEDEVTELTGFIVTKKGCEVERASAGNLRRTSEEIAADPEDEDEFGYTVDKIKKKYAKLGSTIMMVQLERGQQGLGLSLAGHKDRNCMAVFVCGLNPNGAAYQMGEIHVGDEILEVNGIVLHGRCHLNASAIIKGLAGPIFKIILLRRKTAINDIAVRPLTHFPVLLEEVSEDRFSQYPNVRKVAIKKGTHSLGIMIIEGKHAELGQGIFISDIQEGSAAEKAGLEVGELILAVNKESLLDADYDIAANLLKRAEGLVTLILSSPGKKSTTGSVPETTNSEEGKLPVKAVGAVPSRPTTPIAEPPADPTTCKIIPGKDTTIEMLTDNKTLGLFLVGGRDTMISGGIVVVEVFSGGAVEKDGRIQAGDQILDANGVCLKQATNEVAVETLRQTLPKIKLVIYRPEKIEYSIIQVELLKKPGKGFGLSITGRKCGKGTYIAEILNGGNADIDGRLTKGDLLVSVNGENTENLTLDEVGAILKTASGKPTLKFHRYKPTIR